MQTVLNDNPSFNDDGLDAVVIRDNLEAIRGGRSLDVTGFAPKYIRKGHPIIKSTATGQYKPMPVTGSAAIASLGTAASGAGYVNAGTYAGVALVGGTGSGATANITVYNGRVTMVVLAAKGTGYAAGDVLTASAANIGTGGSGFSVPVGSVAEAATYAALPASHTYEGVALATVPTNRAMVGIMVRGSINPAAMPLDFATIAAAFKTACPLITQYAD